MASLRRDDEPRDLLNELRLKLVYLRSDHDITRDNLAFEAEELLDEIERRIAEMPFDRAEVFAP